MRDYLDRRVTLLKRVTSPTWSPPPPCKQAEKQRRSSFCSSNFAPLKNCSLKIKYIQGLILLLKHTRPQPRNRKFQEQAVFKPEKQVIVPKINAKRQTISTTTTVTRIANILRFICSRRCWFEGSWLPGAMVCFSLNPIAAKIRMIAMIGSNTTTG